VTTPRGAGGFVGRSAELVRLEGLLDHQPPVNVVLLHGPAGIGKSALLHELARRAGESTVVAVDAREVAPLAEKVDRALAPAITARRARRHRLAPCAGDQLVRRRLGPRRGRRAPGAARRRRRRCAARRSRHERARAPRNYR